jgi:hypothetical protein
VKPETKIETTPEYKIETTPEYKEYKSLGSDAASLLAKYRNKPTVVEDDDHHMPITH